MKYIYTVLICLSTTIFQQSFAQTFTFHGGIRPNNLVGRHLSVNAEIIKHKKFTYAINYAFVKYIDDFTSFEVKQPRYHIENVGDRTFIDFPQLNRGYPIQKNITDFRPRDIIHTFSIFVGYSFIDSKYFAVNLQAGPHFSMRRNILYNVAWDHAETIINEGDEITIIPFHDYQIYRYWDIGMGSRLDLKYKIMKNLAIGTSGQIYFDLIGESIDLIVGAGISLNFNN